MTIEKAHQHPRTPVDFSGLEVASLATITACQQDLYRRDLAPHDDPVYLVQRINSNNRLLRNAPELLPQIREALLGDDDESLLQLAEDLDIARQLYSPENEKPINTILSFLNLFENINDIRRDLDSEEHIKPRVNVVFGLSYWNLAQAFPEEKLDDARITLGWLMGRMGEASDLAVRQGGTAEGFDRVKVHLGGLFEAVTTYRASYKHADGLPADVGETVSQQEVAAHSAYISELFRSIRSSQQFGVKMGYTSEDDLGGALVFSPPFSVEEFHDTTELHETYHPLLNKTDVVAQILHTQRKHHRRIKVEREVTQGYSAATFNDLGPAALLNLGPDG